MHSLHAALHSLDSTNLHCYAQFSLPPSELYNQGMRMLEGHHPSSSYCITQYIYYSTTMSSQLFLPHINTPIAELRMWQIDLGLDYYKELFEAKQEEFIHRPYEYSHNLFETDILQRTFHSSYEIGIISEGDCASYYIKSPAKSALADAVYSVYALGARIIKLCNWMKSPIDLNNVFDTPDVFRRLHTKGFPTFYPKYYVASPTAYSTRFACIKDLQDFVHSTQWWCLCMRKFLILLAQHEGLGYKTREIEDNYHLSFNLDGSTPSMASTTYTPSPTQAIYNLTPDDALIASPGEKGFQAPELDLDHITQLLAPFLSNLPLPEVDSKLEEVSTPPRAITPLSEPTQTRTIPVFNWKEWCRDGGDAIHTYPAPPVVYNGRFLEADSPSHSEGSSEVAAQDELQTLLDLASLNGYHDHVDFQNFLLREKPHLASFYADMFEEYDSVA